MLNPAAKRLLSSKGINTEEDWERVGPQLCVLCKAIMTSGEPTHYTHQCWLLWCGRLKGSARPRDVQGLGMCKRKHQAEGMRKA